MFRFETGGLKLSKLSRKINENWNNQENRFNPLIVLGFCFFISFLFLLLCTQSSPLYPTNTWCDPNAFFTMGKGMMNGKVIYRDLFEQKGPLLYFLHGLAYLVSNRSFLGVFFLEVVSFTFFLFYCHKILSLFIQSKASLIYLPVIAVFILNLISFFEGDSAEEFCLPLLAISLYSLMGYFTGKIKITDRHFFWNGVISGCVLWIKFSLLGFWVGWIFSIFLGMVVNGHVWKAVKGSLIFLLGMLIATIPWIIYFGINQSIPDWINTYLVVNITSYATSEPFFSRLKYPLYSFAAHTLENPIFCFTLWFGILVFVLFKKYIQKILYRFLLFMCVFLLIFGIYGGGQGYIYYFLIVSPFILFGCIVLFDSIQHLIKKDLSPRWVTAIILSFILISVPYTLKNNHNTHLLSWKKQDLIQYRYASIINQSKDPTLLNYGKLDMGFYTVTGITPNVRFFEQQNLDYARFPLNNDEQNRYIREKVVEYVVLRLPSEETLESANIPYLLSNYEVIASEDPQHDIYPEIWYLLKKRN